MADDEVRAGLKEETPSRREREGFGGDMTSLKVFHESLEFHMKTRRWPTVPYRSTHFKL